MQHGLLALAIALILAIVAALFAPAYVDWNDWRATFERQASELAGTSVQIRGPIEATILPVPAFVLREVRIGDPENSTGISSHEVQGTLSLGALLRGAFEAEEFALVAPTIRIALESGGRIVLPAGGSKAPDELSISRFAISNGSLTLDDRASGTQLYFDRFSALGEIRSRSGPMKLDAAMRLDGQRWNLRMTTGVSGAEGARSRIYLERPHDGFSLDADGLLAFTGGAPRFNGKMNLAHLKGAGLPWKISANANANGDLVTLEALELSAGGGEFPLELAGNLQFAPRRSGSIEGMLTAKRLDLDRVLGIKPGEGLGAIFMPMQETVSAAAALPFKGRIAIAVDLLAANGAQVRDLRGEIGLRDGSLGLNAIEAKLPGRASIQAKAQGGGQGYFRGDVRLEADDPVALTRWALGPDKLPLPEDTGVSAIAGLLDWSRGKLSVSKLDLVLGDAKLRGDLSFDDAGKRSFLKTSLYAEGIDLDPLAPLAAAFWNGAKESDLAVNLNGKSLGLLGRTLPALLANFTRDAGGVSVENLSISDFEGLTVRAKGKISQSDPQARLEFGMQATKTDGLVTVVRQYGGEDFSSFAQFALKSVLPFGLSGTIQGDGKNYTATASGKSADMPLSVSLRTDSDGKFNGTKVTLEAREAGKLVSLFGVSPGLPVPGDGKLELEIFARKADSFPLQASLFIPGTEILANGVISFKGDKLDPRIELKFDASDLRPAIAAASRVPDALPSKGSVKLSREGEGFSFENLSLEIGKSRANGQITLNALEAPRLAGRLSVDRMELTDLLALAAGSSSETKSFWPAVRLSAPPFAGASGAVDMEISALGLTGAQAATNAKFKLKIGETVEITNFVGDYAGGKLAGEGKIMRGDALSFDGRATLTGFDIARVLAPGTWKAAARGRGSLTLALSGSGATPAALASRLSGQGTLSLENLEIDSLDPLAIATVVSAAEKHMPRDESHLIEGVNKMLARAPLSLSKVEAPLIAANGTVRTGKAVAKAGDVDVKADASFDLAKLQVDGSIELESGGQSSARPGLAVRWRGPAGSPSRLLDVSSLSTAINLRAMERETKRLEQRDRSSLPTQVQ